MQINYKKAKLQKLCENYAEAKKRLGEDNANKLKIRINQLIIAQSVQELVAGHPHPLKGDRLGQFAVSLVDPLRLIFEPDNYPIPLKEDGSINWSEVNKICIIEIVDYHD
jgi:proteic killer suppression protein